MIISEYLRYFTIINISFPLTTNNYEILIKSLFLPMFEAYLPLRFVIFENITWDFNSLALSEYNVKIKVRDSLIKFNYLYAIISKN